MEAQEHDTISANDLREAITAVFQDNEANVIAISGEWGSGKTYFLRNYLDSQKFKNMGKDAVFISLFGKKSVSEIEHAIIANSLTYKNNWFLKIIGLAGLKIGSEFIPHGRTITDIAENIGTEFAMRRIVDKVICFDDIERSKIPTDDLMGYISKLSEMQNNFVILMMNNRQFDDEKKEHYSKFYEKVVNYSYQFSLSHEESCEFAFNGQSNEPVRLTKDEITILSTQSKNLQINNIRILKLIKYHYSVIKSQFLKQNIHSGFLFHQFAGAISLLCWAHFEKGKSLDFIKNLKLNSHILHFAHVHDTMPNTEEASRVEISDIYKDKIEYIDFFKAYREIIYDQLVNIYKPIFDAAFMQIATGFLADKKVLETCHSFNAIHEKDYYHHLFDKIDKLRNQGFVDNQDDIAETILRFCEAAIPFINADDTDGIFNPPSFDTYYRMLRDMGKDGMANQILNMMASQVTNPDFFDIENDDMSLLSGQTFHADVKKRFKEAHSALAKTRGYIDILKQMSDLKIYNNDIEYFVTQLTTEEWTKILQNHFTISEVKTLYEQFCSNISEASNHRKEIGQHLNYALDKLSDISPLNQRRVNGIRK